MAQLSMKDAREFMNALNSFDILDANGRYTYVSENWCRMTNCTEENALGRRVEDIVPDTLAHQVYETGQPCTGRFRVSSTEVRVLLATTDSVCACPFPSMLSRVSNSTRRAFLLLSSSS